MKKAAFFDLDGTIVKGVSGVRFTRFLIRRGILKMKISAIIPSLKIVYDVLSGKVEKYMDEVDDLIGLSFKGLREELIKEQAEQYAGLEKHYVYKKVEKIIKKHKKKKHKLFLLSASPHELVEEVGKELGFDESYGTRIKSSKGVYTGVIKKPAMIGKERVKIVKKLAEKYNINLEKSYAYGNCVNDVHVMESVGNPVAVNPNKYLEPIAEKRGWKKI